MYEAGKYIVSRAMNVLQGPSSSEGGREGDKERENSRSHSQSIIPLLEIHQQAHLREPWVEQFRRHSHEAIAYHQTRKDHICSNAHCSAEPFCGEEFAKNHHRQQESGGGTRKGGGLTLALWVRVLEPLDGLKGRKELTERKYDCTS